MLARCSSSTFTNFGLNAFPILTSPNQLGWSNHCNKKSAWLDLLCLLSSRISFFSPITYPLISYRRSVTKPGKNRPNICKLVPDHFWLEATQHTHDKALSHLSHVKSPVHHRECIIATNMQLQTTSMVDKKSRSRVVGWWDPTHIPDSNRLMQSRFAKNICF